MLSDWAGILKLNLFRLDFIIAMSKRRRTDALTGGTGDVSPQFLTFSVQSSVLTGTSTLVQIPLPISRLPTKSGRATVFELLEVQYDQQHLDNYLNVNGSYATMAFLTTSSLLEDLNTIIGNPRTLSTWQSQYVTTIIGVPNNVIELQKNDACQYSDDLTDRAGHGVLVATDALFAGVSIKNTAPAALDYGFRILYRWKDVSLTEYIGILQSQQ